MKNIRKNTGYKIINRKQFTDDSCKRKHRLNSYFVVNVDNEESYIATLMKGKSL